MTIYLLEFPINCTASRNTLNQICELPHAFFSLFFSARYLISNSNSISLMIRAHFLLSRRYMLHQSWQASKKAKKGRNRFLLESITFEINHDFVGVEKKIMILWEGGGYGKIQTIHLKGALS